MDSRREFLKKTALTSVFLGMGGCAIDSQKPLFQISLAEWSLNRSLFSGELDHLDFAATARQEFDINAVEYVNQFFMDKIGRAHV